MLYAVWHACVTLHLTSAANVPDRVPHRALILRVARVGNRFARVLVPCAVQQGDPISAGVNRGELRRRYTACERHNSGPGHCPTVVPPHRQEPCTLGRRVTLVLLGVRGAAVANPISLSVAGTFL